MRRALTEPETFATVLLGLVVDRCKASGTRLTSRTGLQLSVPVNERPGVRRGLDALIDHSALGLSGENIGLTAAGQLLLAKVNAGPGGRLLLDDGETSAGLGNLLDAIAEDERLAPHTPIDMVKTLPARLENYKRERSGRSMWKWVSWLAIVVVISAVTWLARR